MRPLLDGMVAGALAIGVALPACLAVALVGHALGHGF